MSFPVENCIIPSVADTHVLFTITGEFDVSNALNLKKLIKTSFEDQEVFLIDLTNVHYISSTGVGVLLELKKLFNKNVGIILSPANESVYSVISSLCLTTYIPIYETIEKFLSIKT